MGFYSQVDEKNFKQPDMGEYYDEALIEEYYKSINPSDINKVSYYIEEPFSTQLGYHEDVDAFVIKALPYIPANDTGSKKTGLMCDDLNETDGDTVYFDINTIEDGGLPFTINGKQYDSFKSYARINMKYEDYKSSSFKIRTIGINTPEICHYFLVPFTEKSEVVRTTISDAKYKGYKYDKTSLRNDNEIADFLLISDSEKGKKEYGEIVRRYENYPYSAGISNQSKFDELYNKSSDLSKLSNDDENKKIETVKVVYKDDQEPWQFEDGLNIGIECKNAMIDILTGVEDLRLVIDGKTLINRGMADGPLNLKDNDIDSFEGLTLYIKKVWQSLFGDGIYKWLSYNGFGQDAYARWLGVIYIKKTINDKKVWINVNKYIKASYDKHVKLMVGSNPIDYENSNGLSPAFKLWTYDINKTVFADAFLKIGDEDLDDRREIQEQITSYDLNVLKKYTVMIGDCLFMVPPTLIRTISQTQSERVNLLRSKGSMTKQKPHNDRMIELTLYFNNEQGVNGVPVKRKLPNGKEVIYHINGLRSLISQFKLTPFLPIENEYINEVLGVDAVALVNIQMQTMPQYPKCIAATLTLQHFRYRVYMNDLPIPNLDSGEHFDKNMFSNTINYRVMRYYYQKCISSGEQLKNLSPLSNDYIQRTMGNRTNLIPMEFKDDNIEFFILDENWLDLMLQVKEEAAKRPLNQIAPITDAVKSWAYSVGISMSFILDEISDKYFYLSPSFWGNLETNDREDKQIEELNRVLKVKCPLLEKVEILTPKSYKNFTDSDIAGLTFSFNMTDKITIAEFNNLMRAVYKDINLPQDNYKTFVNGVLFIPFHEIVVEEGKDKDEKYKLNPDSNGYKIMELFSFKSGYINGEKVDIDIEDWDDLKTNIQEGIVENVKDNAIDTETFLSAKFKQYPIEKIIPEQISISMANTFANTRLKCVEGYAPQYCGGQDTVIEFKFQTMDFAAASFLNSLQEIASSQLVKYRKVINCWPIRINSEITRLCGINEVLIESTDISTKPNLPGVYEITCRMISVDRTMRNKEALRRLDAINNSGATNSSGITSANFKTYLDLNSTLSKAEIYPDLELPSLSELERTGYKFIRYANDSSRIYPDPDFYFVYGYVHSAAIFKKMIKEYFSKKVDENSPITSEVFNWCDDNTGQLLEVSFTDNYDELLRFDYKNKELKEKYEKKLTEQETTIVESKRATEESLAVIEKSKKVREEYKKLNKEIAEIIPDHWNVCKKIKCSIGQDYSRYTESKEIKDKMESLKKEIIKIIDETLSSPIKEYKKELAQDDIDRGKDIYFALGIGKLYKDCYTNGHWGKIFKVIGVDLPKRDEINKIYYAAQISQSAEIEYSKGCDKHKADSRAYCYTKGDSYYQSDKTISVPYTIIKDNNTSEDFISTSMEQAISLGVTFGRYQIRKYSKETLNKFYGKEYIFKNYDFLDPYYNSTINKNLTAEEEKYYKEMLIESPNYQNIAFDRIILVWTKKLLESNIFLNYLDISSTGFISRYDEIKNELLKDDRQLSDDGMTYIDGSKERKNHVNYSISDSEFNVSHGAVGSNTSNPSTLGPIIEESKDMTNLLKDHAKKSSLGKIFLPLVVACVHGDDYILSALEQRNIATLSEKTLDAASSSYAGNPTSTGELYFRKLIRALYKVDLVDNLSQIADSVNTELEQALQDSIQKLWVRASEDPSTWVMHSFYDMIVNDKRGRMARAFPTYYLMIIDEGREIGYWKLHDNFYNMSAIAEIEVIKSRKIVADTAKIMLTNMYRTFTDEDEDIRTDYYHNLKDVFRNLWNPHAQFEKEESERINQNQVNRVKLRPGARIHLRMGYGGDAGKLPIVFNGVVAEVSSGELVEIVAQGDGHELSNPNAFSGASSEDASKLENESEIALTKWISNFFNYGSTPKELIKNILTTKSTWSQGILRWLTDGRLFNDNMFGIVNFGSIDDKSIHANGEVMQNIYEAEGHMPWTNITTDGTSADEHSDPNPPKFTIELTDKSAWDVLNICAATSIDYITSVATFGLRSTIFFGRGHYYYAYDYDINDTGTLLEKRKPFQQYHLVDSYSDIISNNIKTDASDVRTCAVPIYKGPGKVSSSIEKRVPSPLWIDFDIYPEFQKTITVNTGMTFKGTVQGALFVNKFYDEWAKNGGQKIAWRMGAKALKDSVKDMYKGEVITIGNPVIKPYDKVYMHDIYENMNGAFEVEAVVMRLNTETGFTTSIFPDCISSIDNRYEQVGNMMAGKLFGELCAINGARFLTNTYFNTNMRVALRHIDKIMNGGLKYSTKYLNQIASIVRKDELLNYTKTQKWSENFRKSIGISTSEFNLWNMTNKLNKYADLLPEYDPKLLTSLDDYYKVLKANISTLDDINLNQIRKDIESVIPDNGNIPNKYKDSYDNLIRTITNNGDKLTKDLNVNMRTIMFEVMQEAEAYTDLKDEHLELIRELNIIYQKSDIDTKDAKRALNYIESLSSITQDLYENKELTTTILKHNDDIRDIMRTTSKLMDAKDIKKVFSIAKVSTGPVGAIIAFVAEILIEYVIAKTVYNWVENKLASFNVLQIYPLKKNSVAYVAGLDGHKGLVIGSPTYNQKGIIDSVLDYAFQSDGFMSVIRTLFFSENMNSIYETYRRDNSYGEFNEEALESNDITTSLMQALTEGQVSNYSGYKSIVASKRLDFMNEKTIEYTFMNSTITTSTSDGTTEKLQQNKRILNELIPITKDVEMLRPLFEDGHLKTLHSLEGINDSSMNELRNIRTSTFEFETSSCGKIKTNGLVISEKEAKKQIIDIPFLRPDAYKILYKIVSEVIRLTPPKEKTQYITRLISATAVNDNRWNSTGYIFTILVKDCDFIEEILEDLKNELTSLYMLQSDNKNISILQYKKRSDFKYEIFVAPREELMATNFR